MTSTTRQKIATAFGYWSWFSFCFTIAVVLTFPLAGLKPMIIDQTEKVLGKGKQGAYGSDPIVTIGDLGMSGLGVKATRVQIQLASQNADPGAVIDVDKLWLSASLLSLVSANKTVQVRASLYGGDVTANVTVNEKQEPVAIDADIDDVDLSKVAPIIAKLGVTLEGIVSGDVTLDLGAAAEKDAKGNVDLDVKGLGLGTGKLTIPGVPGDFMLNNGIRLGDLKLRLPIDKGTGPVDLKLEGTSDVEASVTGTLNVKQKMSMSRLDADGWVKPTPAMLAKEPLIKSGLELADQFGGSKAKDDEGRYHFSARGPLSTLKPLMAKDGGRKASSKAARKTPAEAARPPAEPDGAVTE